MGEIVEEGEFSYQAGEADQVLCMQDHQLDACLETWFGRFLKGGCEASWKVDDVVQPQPPCLVMRHFRLNVNVVFRVQNSSGCKRPLFN